MRRLRYSRPSRRAGGLGDRDAVQGGVDLPVPTSGQPEPGFVARPDRLRSGAVPARIGALGGEPGGAGGLADDLRGRQRAAAGDLQQRGSEPADQLTNLPLELEREMVELADALQQLPGDSDQQPLAFDEVSLDLADDALAAQPARANLQRGSISSKCQRTRD